MSKMELLGVLEAEKLTKTMWEQYCGTPCMIRKGKFTKYGIIVRKIVSSTRKGGEKK